MRFRSWFARMDRRLPRMIPQTIRVIWKDGSESRESWDIQTTMPAPPGYKEKPPKPKKDRDEDDAD